MDFWDLFALRLNILRRWGAHTTHTHSTPAPQSPKIFNLNANKSQKSIFYLNEIPQFHSILTQTNSKESKWSKWEPQESFSVITLGRFPGTARADNSSNNTVRTLYDASSQSTIGFSRMCNLSNIFLKSNFGLQCSIGVGAAS